MVTNRFVSSRWAGMWAATAVLLLTTAVLLGVWRQTAAADVPPIVFVARQHLATKDRIFRDELGPAGQFGTGTLKFAPGSKLVLRQADGSLMVYNTPGLVDIQSPDVNFAATQIVFAGAKSINPDSPNFGWRLYEINVDGTGFKQLTFSDRSVTIPNANKFGNIETYGAYHDLFPAYLADGRIVFNSSRYPTRSHYDERMTFNVYVMNGDGGDMHRISTERASSLHPTPLPDGRILVSRWWNQFNQPSYTGLYNRIDDSETEAVTLADGTVLLPNEEQFNPAKGFLPDGTAVRGAPNSWHLMTMNSDGTDFKRYAWTPVYPWEQTSDSGLNDTYTGAQPAVIIVNGNLSQPLVAFTSQQDTTMAHTTLETGIRIAYPGADMNYANVRDAIAGLTFDKAWQQEDTSGPYALHPWGLPDGRILYSQSSVDNSLPSSGSHSDGGKSFPLQGSNLRYQLYTMTVNGGSKAQVAINLASIGLAQADVMDAKPVTARVGWSAQTDQFTTVPSDDPVDMNVPNTLAEYIFSQNGPGQIEMATIQNPNVYANAGLDMPFVNNSPPPGSVAQAEIWLDANQFTGAYCYNDWPQPCANFRQDVELRAVLWDTVPVVNGAFSADIPADVMSFVVLRDENGRLVSNWNRGYASIAQGSSWARPGETVTCVGCHMGHVSGSLDSVMDDALAGVTNVAPYAQARASSFQDSDWDGYIPGRINDRRGWIPKPAGAPESPWFTEDYEVGLQDNTRSWISARDKGEGSWVELEWPVNMGVSRLRLVGTLPNGNGFGEPAQFGDYYVESATLKLYRDGQVVRTIDVGRIQPMSQGGTLIDLGGTLEIDKLRLTINETSGRYWWGIVGAIAEIEVIGTNAEPWPLVQPTATFLPLIRQK